MIRLANGIIVETMIEEITDFYGDGIIVPNNTSLDLNSTLMERLGRKAGKSTLAAAKAKAPIPQGEAVITAGGGLLSNFIIHVALIPSEAEQFDSIKKKRLLRLAMQNGLLRCLELELESIGIPNLGGYLQLDMEAGFRITLAAIAEVQVPEGNPLKKVFCVFLDEEYARTFERIAWAISV